MSRVKTLALTAGVLFALASCAPLFEFNLFGSIDPVPTPTAAKYTGAEGLDQLDEDLDSTAIIEVLTANPALVNTILAQVATEFLGGNPPTSCADAEAAQAAIVYADLALETSGGEVLVQNIVTAAIDGTLASVLSTLDPNATVADILAIIVPTEALADPDAFASMVGALLEANEAYLLLGGYVDAGNDLPPGSLPGDIVPKALVAYIMRQTVDAVIPVAVPATEAQAIAELYKVAKGDPSLATSIKPNPFDKPAPGPDARLAALVNLLGITL